jgi:hypothetical protein
MILEFDENFFCGSAICDTFVSQGKKKLSGQRNNGFMTAREL